MAELFPDSFRDELGDVSLELARIGDLADGVARTISRAFRGAITDGRSLKGVLADIGRAFADIALKAAFRPLEGLISGAVESLFTAMNPAITPFAKGGVIAAPSYFPLARGIGVAGERGAEAVLPLTRGADGRLGVAAAGQGVSVTVNVTASDARSFLGAEAEVSAMLLRAVRRGSRSS
jgi:phage-related minor tail protein